MGGMNAGGPAVPAVVVVGTRPEAIKLVPIILALRASRTYRPVVVSTGQHDVMVQQVLALADIEPDVDLYVGDARSDLNERVPTTIRRFDDFFRAAFPGRPDRMLTADEALSGRWPVAVLVHGDTSSAFAAALASFHRRTPVVHVEAGLRTGGYNWSPFPEELNRQLITCIATFHLAPTEANEQNLVRENVPANQIFVTGNTGIDALHWAAALDVPFDDATVAELYESDVRIVLVTAHRRENWGGGLARIGEGVARLARSNPEPRFIVARHPNPRVRAELSGPLESLDNVLLTEPLAYASFARLQNRCHLVITDSGGIQEEAPSLGKPVLVARESTERTEGIAAGTLRLVGTDPDRIVRAGDELLKDPVAYARMADAVNPYGDGRAAERIVGALEHLHHGAAAPQAFGAGYSRMAVLQAAGYTVSSDTLTLESLGEPTPESTPVEQRTAP
jgi:UDP-N-acetylglucosamine 2-epimerase (non-hydrolysing)